ncbi:hypothetical protein HN51_046645 [Arachis hypogaea]
MIDTLGTKCSETNDGRRPSLRAKIAGSNHKNKNKNKAKVGLARRSNHKNNSFEKCFIHLSIISRIGNFAAILKAMYSFSVESEKELSFSNGDFIVVRKLSEAKE